MQGRQCRLFKVQSKIHTQDFSMLQQSKLKNFVKTFMGIFKQHIQLHHKQLFLLLQIKLHNQFFIKVHIQFQSKVHSLFWLQVPILIQFNILLQEHIKFDTLLLHIQSIFSLQEPTRLSFFRLEHIIQSIKERNQHIIIQPILKNILVFKIF